MPMKPFPDMTFGADPELFVIDRTSWEYPDLSRRYERESNL